MGMATFPGAQTTADSLRPADPAVAEPAYQEVSMALEDEDEVEVSDEDIAFFEHHGSSSRFLVKMEGKELDRVGGSEPAAADKTEEKRKRKREGLHSEAYYEKQARKTVEWEQKGEGLSVEAVDALPVKTPQGRLVFRRFPRSEPGGESEAAAADEQHGTPKPGAALASQGGEAAAASERRREPEVAEEEVDEAQRRLALQQQMAELATSLLADPEGNLPHLRELQELCEDRDGQAATLAMLSLASVYADILPGYRIRLPTEKEAAMPVSTEVRKLRDYEAALLRAYQGYVQFLLRAVRAPAMRLPALRCTAALLTALPYFNFRDSLLAAIVPRMDSPDDVVSQTCCGAILEVVRNEGKHGGEASLEAVQLIADLVRQRHCQLRPEVLQVLLQLRFDETLVRASGSASGEKKGRKGPPGTAAAAAANSQTLLSKRQRKAEKKRLASRLHKEVEADFREAQAVADVGERQRLQGAVLAAVFETLFRVLKSALHPPSARLPEGSGAAGRGPRPLLAPALEGLGRFSHLISADFMGDLLEVLRQLAGGGDGLPVAERLGCCVAAFRIVKSNLDALTVDLRDFYAHLYALLLEAPLAHGEEAAGLAEALQSMLWEGRQTDLQRCAAFVHRLAAAALHLDSARAVAVLLVAGHLLQRHAKCRSMLENEAGGGGGVLPRGGQVEHAEGAELEAATALRSVLWPPPLLARHFHPAVSALATKVAALGEGGAALLQPGMTPVAAVATYSTAAGGFRPGIPAPRGGRAPGKFRTGGGAGMTAQFAALLQEGGQAGSGGGSTGEGSGWDLSRALPLEVEDETMADKWRSYFRDLREHRQKSRLLREWRRVERLQALMMMGPKKRGPMRGRRGEAHRARGKKEAARAGGKPGY